MSWVSVLWLFVASACLTLSAIHFLIGVRQPRRSHLWFALCAFSGAAVAGLELALLRADTPERYGEILRWIHVPIFVLVASLVLFIRSFFNAGRPWLAGAAIALRGAASLVVNFLRSPNINYAEITGLRRIPFLGETVSVAEGTVSRWTRLGEFSSLLVLAFLVDATATVWRRGDRHRATLVGGSAFLFVLTAAVNSALVHGRLVQTPYLISLPYFAILAAMSYELTSDVLHAADLSRRLDASQEALRESESRMTMVTDAANLGLWFWDVASDEFWMTARGRARRGHPPAERIDLRQFLAPVHPEDRDRVRKSFQESLEKGGEFEREYRLVRGDGEIRWISALGRVEFAGGGRPARVLGVSIDVTRRKLAELESERSRAELAHLSRVAMLGELSGSLAHELNQPLTAILSNAQAALRFLSRDGVSHAELFDILGDIVEQDKHAGEVIARLRLLMKKGEVNVQALDLAEVFQDVLKLMRTDLLNRGVTVQTEWPADLPPVRGDRVEIQQVLLNLVVNGSDAMAGAEATHRRLLLRAEIADGGVHVSLADRGRGVPPSEIERIFEPFVTMKSQGMGLGLAICKTIIAAHGGRIWATNNADGGATFHFTLPRADAEPS
ncbi:MAG: sensor histidine kinase [Acidithiobacillales bacterium]